VAKWLLLDGFNLAFRSFYGIPELSRSDGFPTNAIHGFVRTLWYLEDHEKPDRVAIFWDLGGSQERLALMPTYKANRSEPPEAFTLQIPWMKKLSLVLGYALVEEEGVEADDLIASAAIKLKKNGAQVCIVSSDKDLAQILQPGIVQLLPPPTQNPKLGWRKLAYDGVIEKFGVPVEKMVDYLSLMGDSSDNIAGLPGVGPKTAVKWIQEYGSVEGVISKVNYIEPKRFQFVVPGVTGSNPVSHPSILFSYFFSIALARVIPCFVHFHFLKKTP